MILLIGRKAFAANYLLTHASCGQTAMTTSKYDTSANSSVYHIRRYYCGSCGRPVKVENESHTFSSYTSAGASGHYKNKCWACGYKKSGTDLLSHTYTVTTEIGVTKYKCSDCGYYYYESGSEIIVPTSETSYYYKLTNPSQTQSMSVDIELRSPTTASTARKGTLITYTDTIPAGTTRTYIYYLAPKGTLTSYSMHPIAVFGYVDGDNTVGTLLAVAAPYVNSYTYYTTSTTYTTSAGTVYNEWTEVSGSPTITFNLSDLITSKTYIRGGAQSNATLSNMSLIATGVNRVLETYAQAYGSVKLTYTLPDTTAPELVVEPSYQDNIVAYDISAYDDVAVTSLTINNGASETITDGFYNGVHTIGSPIGMRVVASDAAGNQSIYYNAVYSITYNENGGNSTIATMYKASGLDRIITEEVPTKDNCEFLGWNTNSSGTGDTYLSGSLYTANANVTLYAMWGQAEVPTVTLKLPTGASYTQSWTNTPVIVTLTATGATNYEYSTNGTTWQSISGLSMNGNTGTVVYSNYIATIYFRTVNGSMYSEATTAYSIKIDTEAPSGTVNVTALYTSGGTKYVKDRTVTLNLTASDDHSTSANLKMAFLNEDTYNSANSSTTLTWKTYSTSTTWTSSSGGGLKRVYVIFKDEAGNQSLSLAGN